MLNRRPKIAIYTAIFGDYDPLKMQVPQQLPVDFLCFTDGRPAPHNWQVIHVPTQNVPPRQQAKEFKLLPHRIPQLAGYDYTIWIDGSMQITSADFAPWAVSCIKNSGWAIFTHNEFSCAYEEAAAMAVTKKYRDAPLGAQAAHYRATGFPDQSGLYMNALIARDMHNTQWQKLCEAWWQENLRWTLRDAVSLPYVLWRGNGKLDVIAGDIYQSPFFRIYSAYRTHEYDRNDRP